MIPNIHIHEQLMFERHHALQHEMAQQSLIAGLPQHHFSLPRHLADRLGALLVTFGTSLRQLELSKR